MLSSYFRMLLMETLNIIRLSILSCKSSLLNKERHNCWMKCFGNCAKTKMTKSTLPIERKRTNKKMLRIKTNKRINQRSKNPTQYQLIQIRNNPYNNNKTLNSHKMNLFRIKSKSHSRFCSYTNCSTLTKIGNNSCV